jgi:hypothetical protein
MAIEAGLSESLCVEPGLTIDLEPIAEHDCELSFGSCPFAWGHLPYMDAPLMPSALFGLGSQE